MRDKTDKKIHLLFEILIFCIILIFIINIVMLKMDVNANKPKEIITINNSTLLNKKIDIKVKHKASCIDNSPNNAMTIITSLTTQESTI